MKNLEIFIKHSKSKKIYLDKKLFWFSSKLEKIFSESCSFAINSLIKIVSKNKSLFINVEIF